ncbi:YjhG/YagF family D-xylonate dehydratase [Pseudoxanthomonas broegbernensis]|uniref:YjhG/YagF family D-xylonate dehydratase n=1 Tax=Pseudoxanthomonas broegbernensis TaxID=83619 RepID=A0A7V8GKQ5_9GAMM|nr:YjhG/YagF family D-xylonate dehydratase [Pseudoxanthomonas broegbernensis]KAF1685319.1 YjhG/YagF family D-xylonate dehydratase [Pseudoxanthomonas broegbernensis]MBB6066186.1 putative YjhG/YagF family dehydratase [Pseudoxanthomonas broegbernensis]
MSAPGPGLDAILGDGSALAATRTCGEGPSGSLPIDARTLREAPSGHLFGMTQNAGMGWRASEVARDPYLIVSTQGGLRAADGQPVALGLHTGHWEIDRMVRAAAETFAAHGGLPFSVMCSDPCDGRTQGTTGMFDSLPYRNDAAVTMRRLIRSLPSRRGVLGVATCDKGLPATMLALAGCADLPGVIVPGGVTLPARGAEDTALVQTIGARFAHGLIDLQHAAEMGCKACGSPGGGCQFLGTAATSQVIAEALGIALPHSALAPSGEPAWLDIARRSALALMRLAGQGTALSAILTREAVENALVVHAAFGGSTNLLLHVPAIAHAAGVQRPTVEDWIAANRATPRLVDALPNGPRHHPTVQVFMAGGVPEVMLHLRAMGLLHLDVPTVSGRALGDNLDWWERSDARRIARERLRELDGVDPDNVIMGPDAARAAGLTSALVFPRGNLAPEGSVIKATSIDPGVVDADNVYRHTGRARVFATERDAIRAIKAKGADAVVAGDIVVLAGCGPAGTGMEETYQLTSALKHLPWGKHVAVITDARFSGVSTGACIGHVGPEALAGGPIGRLRDGDVVRIEIDRTRLEGRIDFIGTDPDAPLQAATAAALLAARAPHPGIAAHPRLPADTRLWAALQEASGGAWGGCVYDVDRIVEVLRAGRDALARPHGRVAGEDTGDPS